MKTLGCDFCCNWQNVGPAKYIAVIGDIEFKTRMQQANKDKKFFLSTPWGSIIIDKCPKCGYVFTSEDYDNY